MAASTPSCSRVTDMSAATDLDLTYHLASAGFTPIDEPDTAHHRALHTIGYFARGGWAAVRTFGGRATTDGLAFVRYDDGEIVLLHTDRNGMVLARATFTLDRLGVRLFANAAHVAP